VRAEANTHLDLRTPSVPVGLQPNCQMPKTLLDGQAHEEPDGTVPSTDPSYGDWGGSIGK
jgi:hypothetical protein